MTELGQRRNILVIDDHVPLGKAVRRMLVDHDVTPLSDARDALAKITAGERYDLILCDLMMPEMTGMELHTALVALAPDQAEKMVFMTGGATEEAARTFFDRVKNPTLEKPFDRVGLLDLLASLLP